MHPYWHMLTTEGDMDISEIILDEVKRTRAEQAELRKELKHHIEADNARLEKIKDAIHCISTKQAVTNQQAGFIPAAISTVVAVVVSVVSMIFTGHVK